MVTIYVFDNALLGDGGDEFEAALIDQHEGRDNESCLEWFLREYDWNSYSASFTPPSED